MAIIAPFKGIFYNPERIIDLARVVTPPYDVITPEDQERYYQAHPHNCIRIILGKDLPTDHDQENRYLRAARFFREWQENRTLVRDPRPALYLYQHTFQLPDRGSLERWGFIALLRLEPFTSGMVRPHEKTFSAHKTDRFNLITHTQANFCPIFSFYHEPRDWTLNTLRDHLPPKPQVSFTDENHYHHRIWKITEPGIIRQTAEHIAKLPVYIADGHHRYERSLRYEAYLLGQNPELGPHSTGHYALMYFCNMTAPGLVILPTHRVVTDLPRFLLPEFLARVEEDFRVERIPFPASDPAGKEAAFLNLLGERGMAGHTFGVYARGDDHLTLLSLKEESQSGTWGQDLDPQLRDLDTMILSRLIIQKVLGISKEALDNEKIIEYVNDAGKALALVREGRGTIALLLNPTRAEQVKAVADASLMMPRKSTFFYPKMLSGLVMNKIIPEERIGL
jgi:uncharacterized protein (DUF1015 family)